jgi:CRP-like cAMP-binding protein
MIFNTLCSNCKLKHSTAFEGMSDGSIQHLEKEKKECMFKKGDFLFHKGENSHGFFCIHSGTVRTFIVAASGKEQSFTIAGPGNWVGCRDTILEQKYNHSAICLEDVYACYVSKSVSGVLLQKDDTYQTNLLKQMALSWQEAENQIYSLGTKQIHGKLAELLVTLHDTSEVKPEIELKITREVMASMIGTTTESVIRALSDFKVRDWITIDKNKIVIHNFNAVFEISEINKYYQKY